MFMLLMLIVAVLGGMGLMSVERALHRAESVPAIEAKVEEKEELDWLDENWDDPKYVAMIHRTRELEQDNFGYVVSVCLCTYHDNLAKQTAQAEADRLEREEWWDVDPDKVNAATRAQKLVTYRTYYNTKDEPGYKEPQQLQMERWRDHLGREHVRAASIPTAQFVTPNEHRAGFIDYGRAIDKYVSDPYSERMRLKEELRSLQWQLEKLSAGFTASSTGYSMSTEEYKAYKIISDRIRQIKAQLPAYTSYPSDHTISKRYSRGGEVEDYVMEDVYGKVIKRWKSGRY